MLEALLSSVQGRRGHFRYESGHHSDWWMDLETLCLHPSSIRGFAAELANRLRPFEVDVVCGPLNEGAFIALLVATQLECDFAYAERFADATSEALFSVEYRLPAALHPSVRGKRVAIVNDVISAGSAVRGAYAHLNSLGARVVVIGSLMVLGTAIASFTRDHAIALETLSHLPNNLWEPADCPLCRTDMPLEVVSP
jgi:orotate phosphoribosyltransferase